MSTQILDSDMATRMNSKPMFLEIDGVLYEISEQNVQMDSNEPESLEVSNSVLSTLNIGADSLVVSSPDTSLTSSALQQTVTVETVPCTSDIFHTEQVVLNEGLSSQSDHGYHSLQVPVPGFSQRSTGANQDMCTVIEVPMVEGNQDEDLAVIASGLAKANLTKVEQMVADLAQGEDKCTYQIIQNGSRQGRPLLVDSLGYTYTVKRVTKSVTYWHCPSRDKTHSCPAAIIQDGKGFHRHTAPHDHDVHPENSIICRISSQAKNEAILPENSGKSASVILKDVLMKFPDEVVQSPLFKRNNLERMINRERQSYRDRTSTAPRQRLRLTDSDTEDPIENVSADVKTVLSAAELAAAGQPVEYEILYNAYVKGLPLLVTSKGHAYTVMKQVGELRYWQCPKMRHGLQCPSVVIEQDGKFFADDVEHSHPPDPERQLRRKVKAEVWKMMANFRKQKVHSDLLIEEVLAEVIKKNPQYASLLGGLRKWSIKYVPKIMQEYQDTSGKRYQQLVGLHCVQKGQTMMLQKFQESRVWPEFEILQHGTVRAQPLLITQDGHCFAIKRGYSQTHRKHWQCSSRSRPHYCPAAISERNGKFFPNKSKHTHVIQPGHGVIKRINNQINLLLASAPTCYMDAGVLVEEAVRRITEGAVPVPSMRMSQWKKMVKRIQERITNGGKGMMLDILATQAVGNTTLDAMDDDHADDADDEEDVADMEVTVEVPEEADQSEVSMESPVAETMEEEESHIIHVSNDGRIMVKTRVTKSAKVSAKESPKKSPKESPEEPADYEEPSDEDTSDILYAKFPTGSQHKTPLLVDSLGYTYTQRLRRSLGLVRWVCSVRSDNLYCPAFVNENNGIYTRSLSKHRHQGKPQKYQMHFISLPKKTPRKSAYPQKIVVSSPVVSSLKTAGNSPQKAVGSSPQKSAASSEKSATRSQKSAAISQESVVSSQKSAGNSAKKSASILSPQSVNSTTQTTNISSAKKSPDAVAASGFEEEVVETIVMETEDDDKRQVKQEEVLLSEMQAGSAVPVKAAALGTVSAAQKEKNACKDLVAILQCRLKADKKAEKKKISRDEPTDLNFELHLSSINDGFLKKDLRVDEQRHIIFATETQVMALQSAKLLYVDCTTRLVKEPFVRLVTIQAWMKVKEKCELIPLVYVLMSCCRKKDYKRVFKVIRQMITENLPIKRITASYERPLWQALWKTFPNVPVYGCVYQWTLDVWAKMVELGLKPLYEKHGPTYNYLCKVLALPFLPQPHIPTMFTALQAQAGGKQLEELMAYIDLSWITNTMFTIAAWSTYKRVFRTREQIEASLPRARPNQQLPFYMLIRDLHVLSCQLMPMSTLTPVNHKKMYAFQQEQTSLQGLMIAEWDCYLAGRCTATMLLNHCSDHSAAMLL